MTAQQDKNDTHGRLRDGVDTVKDRASHAYDTASDKAKSFGRQASDAIDANPLGVLVGGLAVGAIAGAIIPKSAKEKELLAPLGQKVSATAAAALAAAKETGRSELDNIGLSKGAAKDQARTLFQNVAKAAGTAGKAALDAGKEQAKHSSQSAGQDQAQA